MKSFATGCAFLLLLTSMLSGAHAADFEAALSKETAQFTFRSDSSVIGWGGSDLALGFFFSEEDDFVVDASLMQMRQASEETPLTFGVGIKGYLGHLDPPDDDLFAFAIGGEVRYTIPGRMPMAIYGRAFYAPDITSFGDVDEIIDYQAGFQIEALPQTIAFVGIRHFEAGLDDGGSYELDDDNVHIGVRLTF